METNLTIQNKRINIPPIFQDDKLEHSGQYGGRTHIWKKSGMEIYVVIVKSCVNKQDGSWFVAQE